VKTVIHKRAAEEKGQASPSDVLLPSCSMNQGSDSGMRVTKLLRQAEADPQALQQLERFRRTLVVMFSDIQGSTAYFESHGDTAGLFMLHQCDNLIRSHVETHGGIVIKTIGDGTMMTFPEPKHAVQAAIEIQRSLTELDAARAEGDRIALRIGMHYGTGIVRTTDVFGDVVNMASRVETAAGPGHIALSEEMFGQVCNYGFTIEELGRFVLKGKTGERTLFHVRWQQKQASGPDVISPSPLSATRAFKLHVVNHKEASAAADYPVQSEIGVGLSAANTLLISHDLNLPDLWARIFLENQSPFVEESNQSHGIFLRLTGGHVLENADIFLAGRQLFRFEEKLEPTSVTGTINAQGAVAFIAGKAAMLVRTDSAGNPIERCPLNALQVQLGRTVGTYTFPDDQLMSRSHALISKRGEDFVLEDASSHNGTFVQVRKKTPLSVGSTLLIAGHLLKIIE
jgi:class 3 adenylate cyclase